MRKPWFNPKRYGWGAGLPCSWEGWVVLAVFMTVTVGSAYTITEHNWRLRAAIIIIAVLALTVITATRTRGGWRWRWGRD